MKRQNSNREMTIDEIKSFLFQLEAEKKGDGVGVGGGGAEAKKPWKTYQSKTWENKAPSQRSNNCHRCNQSEHWMSDCPLRGGDEWLCKTVHSPRKSCHGAGAGENNTFNNKGYNKKGFGGGSNIEDNKNQGRAVNKSWKITKRKPHWENKKALKAGGEKVKIGDNNGENIEIREIEETTDIADPASDDHIVDKSLILSNFEKCNNWVIKSANANESADMIIDGKGDLLLRTNRVGGTIKLSNVLAVRDISENILSLRRLAEAGFRIYMDDKVL